MKPPRVWPSFVTLVLALLAILISGAGLGVVVLVAPGSRDATPAELLATPGFLISAAALSQVCLLAAVFFLPRLFRDVGERGWADRVGWRWERFSAISGFSGRLLFRRTVNTKGTCPTGSRATHVSAYSAI